MANPVQSLTPRSAIAITPSDTTVYGPPVGSNGGVLDALYVGATAGGNLAVTTEAGDVVTFIGVPIGTIIPVRCTKVMSTNTTSASIVGLRY